MVGFVLDAILPLECFSNMAVMHEIVSCTKSRILLCAFCVCVRAFFLSSNGDHFVHQFIGMTSRCQACSKVFNVLLKHNFRRVCPEEPKRFSFNESFLNACWVAALEE